MSDYNQASHINPDSRAYSNRGILYSEQGKPDLALSDYNQAININPRLALAYNNSQVLHAGQGKPDLALSDYNQAVNINPTIRRGLRQSGLLYQQQGKRGPRPVRLQQVRSTLIPDWAVAYNNWRVSLRRTGETRLRPVRLQQSDQH
ncbi:MAG UNVERIFIED_CONTAM: tetratricopeptide repeat protein [Microcystis novacekii LVE1205-3]